jgi:hypothetical protein
MTASAERTHNYTLGLRGEEATASRDREEILWRTSEMGRRVRRHRDDPNAQRDACDKVVLKMHPRNAKFLKFGGGLT